jgi:hypothetical protein
VGDLQKLGRTKGPDLANIKEEGPVFPENLHIERRVSKGRIDQFCMKERFQVGPSFPWKSGLNQSGSFFTSFWAHAFYPLQQFELNFKANVAGKPL